MPTVKKPRPYASDAALLILQLRRALQSIESLNRNDLWPLQSSRTPPPEFAEARSISDRLIAIVKSANPEMLSSQTLIDSLIYKTAVRLLDADVTDEEVTKAAEAEVKNLVDFEAWRWVDVPIISLDPGELAFKIGPVIFCRPTEEDKSSEWWHHLDLFLGDAASNLVVSYGRVYSPGDLETSARFAERTVSESLLTIRAIGFPISVTEIQQIGVINDYPTWGATPFRLGEPKENIRLEFPSPYLRLAGGQLRAYNLKSDILAKLDESRLSALMSILNEKNSMAIGAMKAKLLNGLRWLGEATKPDATDVRYLKLSFALEALVGGEPNTDYLTTRGVTASLAERSALLAGSTRVDRIQIDHDVRMFYGKRSKIVHGQLADIQPEDLEGFGLLVRRVAWGLLDRVAEFNNVDALQEWVVNERYADKAYRPVTDGVVAYDESK